MTTDDLAEVVALEDRIQTFPWSIGNFRDSIFSGHGCWLRRIAGRVAAFAVTMPALDETELLDIGVAPDLQRHGLGRELLDFLCTQARLDGMLRMLLEVRPSNQGAIAFYHHFDFVEIGRRRGYYPAAEGREDAILMAKTL